MSKTPFEIRLELIHIAKDALWNNFSNDFHMYQSQYEGHGPHAEFLPRGPKDENGIPTFLKPPLPPSSKDVIAYAEELNEFVSQTPERRVFTVDVGTRHQFETSSAEEFKKKR